MPVHVPQRHCDLEPAAMILKPSVQQHDARADRSRPRGRGIGASEQEPRRLCLVGHSGMHDSSSQSEQELSGF